MDASNTLFPPMQLMFALKVKHDNKKPNQTITKLSKKKTKQKTKRGWALAKCHAMPCLLLAVACEDCCVCSLVRAW
jgi:hypothetical protein